MSRTTSWWGGLSGPAKFRVYTRVTLQVTSATVIATVALVRTGPWSITASLLIGVATLVALETQPALATRPGGPERSWVLRGSAVVLLASWLGCLGVAVATSDADVSRSARELGTYAVCFGALGLLPFLRHRWWLLAGASVVSGLTFGSTPVQWLGLGALVLVLGGFVLGLMLLTLWGLRLVDDLERVKDVEAELQVAEERLRFARDLHDVVGRSFSTIAVKSELAATLSRAGEAERAGAEMAEVKALAVDSMEEMRSLVRGYRDIDLSSEVAGARSLLSSAGCRLVVEGDPDRVPSQFHVVAAWVVREGATNIVRHSRATAATLAMGPAGMTLRNDGVTGRPGERSGLRGLSERLAATGATLATTVGDGDFTLRIRWEAAA